MHFRTVLSSTLLGRIASAAVLIAASILSPVSSAQAADRIAVLVSSSEPAFEETLSGFRSFLVKLGISSDLEVYRLSRDPVAASGAVERINKNRPRLIFAIGSLGLDALVRSKVDIPIISCLVLRPEAFSASPNATGVSLEFPLKLQFERMKTILPNVQRVGILYHSAENGARVEEASRIAESMGMHLVEIEIDSPRDVPSALQSLSRRIDVLWGLPDTMTLSPQLAKHTLLFTFRNSIPFIGPSDAWTRAGALYSLDRDYQDIGAQCAEMAARILHGTPVSAIAPATPRKVFHSLNLKTMQQMRISVPDEVVKKARRTY
jgi:putative tryptophan/tyrosine transport system substrate-binding protein